MLKRKALSLLASAAVIASVLFASPRADAIVVERVVAVIGERALFLSDLRKRSRPFMGRLYAQIPPGPQRAAAESRIYSELVEVMVNEQLINVAAAQANTSVSQGELEKALRNVARAEGVPLSQLFKKVEARSGLTEVNFRAQIRRQVLEGKLLNRAVRNQRVEAQELLDMLVRVREQERAVLLYKPAWIVVRLGKEPTKKFLAQKTKLAESLTKRARGGEDFAALAKEFSEDPSTSDNGGDLGIRAPARSPHIGSGKYKRLAKELEVRTLVLQTKGVSEPFRFKDALVILKVKSRQTSRYKRMTRQVKAEMTERVRSEHLQKAKKKWLKNLRRRTRVEIRL